jgi:hypothetical protein
MLERLPRGLKATVDRTPFDEPPNVNHDISPEPPGIIHDFQKEYPNKMINVPGLKTTIDFPPDLLKTTISTFPGSEDPIQKKRTPRTFP